MSKKPFTIPESLYVGRDFDPVVKLSFDMAVPGLALQADIGKNGIAVVEFVVNVAHVLPIPYTGGLWIKPTAYLK